MSTGERLGRAARRHPGKIALASGALVAGGTAYDVYRAYRDAKDVYQGAKGAVNWMVGKKKSNMESGDQNAATALSEAELEQRRAAGKASAEKRRNRSGD